MKEIKELTGLYSLTKTIGLELKPVGKTQQLIESKKLIEQDDQRAEDYKIVKDIIDRYHKDFIDKCLNSVEIKKEDLEEYVSLAENSNANYASREQREKEERIRMVMEYCHYYLPRIADQETVNHICTEVDKWMNLNTYTPKPIQRPFTKDINNIPLRHFVWNISERFLYKRYYNGDNRAKFIKALFPKSFADTDLSTIKNFKVEPLKTEIPIDEPENGKLDFHYPEDYVRN